MPPGPRDRAAQTLSTWRMLSPAGVLQDCLFNTGISQLSSRMKHVYNRIDQIPAGLPCQRWQLTLWGFFCRSFSKAHASVADAVPAAMQVHVSPRCHTSGTQTSLPSVSAVSRSEKRFVFRA